MNIKSESEKIFYRKHRKNPGKIHNPKQRLLYFLMLLRNPCIFFKENLRSMYFHRYQMNWYVEVIFPSLYKLEFEYYYMSSSYFLSFLSLNFILFQAKAYSNTLVLGLHYEPETEKLSLKIVRASIASSSLHRNQGMLHKLMFLHV